MKDGNTFRCTKLEAPKYRRAAKNAGIVLLEIQENGGSTFSAPNYAQSK